MGSVQGPGQLGVWSEDENIRLKAEHIATEFTPAALEAAEIAASKSLDDSPREIFEHNVVTIDSVATRDIDDAISFRADGANATMGARTEAAFYVEHNSDLDQIRERPFSIYMPDLTLPMIPTVLSEQVASLVQGEFRPAISAVAVFDADFQMIEFSIVRSLIKVGERLSYEETDRRIGA